MPAYAGIFLPKIPIFPAVKLSQPFFLSNCEKNVLKCECILMIYSRSKTISTSQNPKIFRINEVMPTSHYTKKE